MRLQHDDLHTLTGSYAVDALPPDELDEFERHLTPGAMRNGLGLWAWFARRPFAYRLLTRAAAFTLGIAGRRRGRFARLPLAGGWTKGRDLPAPEGDTFFARYRREQRARSSGAAGGTP